MSLCFNSATPDQQETNAYRRTTTGKTREVKCKTREVKWKFKIHFLKIQAAIMDIEAASEKKELGHKINFKKREIRHKEHNRDGRNC